MIEHTGIVLAVADEAALVEVQRESSCRHCGHSDSCGTATVAKLFGQGATVRLRVHDPLGLSPGEGVIIGVHNQVLVRASLVAYLLPLITAIGAAGSADGAGFGDVGSALAAGVGLALGLLLTMRITGGSGARSRFRPQLLRRRDGDAPTPTQMTHSAAINGYPLHPSVGG